MKLIQHLPKLAIVAFLVGGAAVVVSNSFNPQSKTIVTDIKVPKLSALAKSGENAFNTYCAACHGKNAGGSDKGPPLVQTIYNPGHHEDQSFFLAAQKGVPSHHWRFGNMPPVPNVNTKELTAIVRYIREMQTANGIFYKRHKM